MFLYILSFFILATNSLFNFADPGAEYQWPLCHLNLNESLLLKSFSNFDIGIIGGPIVVHDDIKGFKAFNSINSVDFEISQANNSAASVKLAGIMGATGDNNLCIVGASPSASIEPFIVMDTPYTLASESSVTSYLYSSKAGSVEVFVHDWLPPTFGVYQSPSSFLVAAIKYSFENSRGNLGGFHVFPAGNGRVYYDDSNKNPYRNLPYAFTVGSITDNVSVAYYSNPGANLIAVAPSSGGTYSVPTTLPINPAIFNEKLFAISNNDNEITPSEVEKKKTQLKNCHCTNNYGGTEASAGFAASYLLHLLKYDFNMDPRKAFWITALSATKVDSLNPTWRANQAGFCVSEDYGFGRLDVGAATTLAKSWDSFVLPSVSTSSVFSSIFSNTSIPDNSKTGINSTISVSGVSFSQIEHVSVLISLDHEFVGDLVITLYNNGGSYSNIISFPSLDGTTTLVNQTFTSLMHFGEDPNQDWTLNVADVVSGDIGIFHIWSISFMGPSSVVTAPISIPNCSVFDNSPPVCSGLYPSIRFFNYDYEVCSSPIFGLSIVIYFILLLVL